MRTCLTHRTDLLEVTEKNLKKKIFELRVLLPNEPDAIVSPHAAYWKVMLEKDLSSFRFTQPTKRRNKGPLTDKKLERYWIHGDSKKIRKSIKEKKRVPKGSKSTLQQRHRLPALMPEGTISAVFEKVEQVSSIGTNNAKVQKACIQGVVSKSNPWKEKKLTVQLTVQVPHGVLHYSR